MIENYNGYVITIKYDYEALNPNDLSDKIVFLIAKHRDFDIYPPSWVVSKKGKRTCSGYSEEYVIDARCWKKMPLYAYVRNGGVSLSLRNTVYPFNDQVYACQVGEVFVIKNKKLNTNNIVQQYLQDWSDYLSGQVWKFTIASESGEVIESGNGIYGDADAVRRTALGIINLTECLALSEVTS